MCPAAAGCNRLTGGLAPQGADAAPGSERIAAVDRIVDGDTIKLATGERVRFIGVDTPELARDGRPAEPFAQQAAKCNRDLLGRGPVKLVFDRAPKDKYGRLLAYVYAGPDYKTFVNRELVSRGCAETLFIPPNMKHAREFRGLEKQARTQGLGLWKQ